MLPEDKEALVREYLPVIRRIASRIANKWLAGNYIDYEDLVNTGVIGLLEAYERFDTSDKSKFLSFATKRIYGAMIDALRQLMPVNQYIYKRIKEMTIIQTKLEHRLMRPVSNTEIAEEMGMPIEEVDELLQLRDALSAGDIKPIEGTESEEHEDEIFSILEDSSQCPDRLFSQVEMLDLIYKTANSLPGLEGAVFIMYYYHNMTNKQIGEMLGYTEGRISQLRKSALRRMRYRLRRRLGREV